MLTGFAGILFAAGGQVSPALLCLMGAGFCDMFDGKIASTRPRTQQEKRFGIQIDSLSDLVCFGVLPAVIVWCAEVIRNEVNKLNRTLVGYKQIRAVEIRRTEFEKTTSRKIKRHLVK